MTYPLTIKDNDVIDCLMKGMNRKEMAKTLGLEPNTIKQRVQTISKRMGIDHTAFLPRIRIVYLMSRGNSGYV